MCDAIAHRGPDAAGEHLVPGQVAIGFRRLAIIDLETGNQPIPNEDSTVHVTCNGEIYNFRDLRSGLRTRGHSFRSDSDTEVIAHLYEERGVECLDALQGMFAIALWDQGAERLLLARDRLGVKPLYWAPVEGGLLYASEPGAILASGLVEPRPDPEAIAEYLTLQYVPPPRSGFAGIHKLAPGERLVFERGAIRVERYWQLDFSADRAAFGGGVAGAPRLAPRRGDAGPARGRRAAGRLSLRRHRLEPRGQLHGRGEQPGEHLLDRLPRGWLQRGRARPAGGGDLRNRARGPGPGAGDRPPDRRGGPLRRRAVRRLLGDPDAPALADDEGEGDGGAFGRRRRRGVRRLQALPAGTDRGPGCAGARRRPPAPEERRALLAARPGGGPRAGGGGSRQALLRAIRVDDVPLQPGRARQPLHPRVHRGGRWHGIGLGEDPGTSGPPRCRPLPGPRHRDLPAGGPARQGRPDVDVDGARGPLPLPRLPRLRARRGDAGRR